MHYLKATVFLGLRSLLKTRILFVFEAAVDIRYAVHKLTNGDCGAGRNRCYVLSFLGHAIQIFFSFFLK